MYFSDLLGRRHGPFPLNSQFYIHVTFPNVLPAYLGEEKSTVRIDEKLMALMTGG